MTEWGSLFLVDQGEGDRNGYNISFFGVKKGDMSSRYWKSEVRVVSIQFFFIGNGLLFYVEMFLYLYVNCFRYGKSFIFLYMLVYTYSLFICFFFK